MGISECGFTDFKDIGQPIPALNGWDLAACKKCGRVHAKNLLMHDDEYDQPVELDAAPAVKVGCSLSSASSPGLR